MARIKYSGLVTSINGSSGGTTFQKNLYGDTLKNKSHMATPRSFFQNQSKIFIQQCTNEWRTLNNTERQSWINYANAYPMATRLNPDAFLNGFNYFVKFNCLRLLAGLAFLRTVSLTQYNGAISGQVLEYDGVDYYHAFSYSSFAPQWYVLVFISPVIQGYTNPRTNKTRFIRSYSTLGGLTYGILTTAYPARMGAQLVVGQSYYVDTTFLNNLSGQILELPTAVIPVTL